MRQKIFSLIVMAFFFLIQQCANVAYANSKPQIKIDQNTFDFGQLQEGVKVEHVFNLTNEGTALLRIGKLRTNCECTVATVKNAKLKPGESTELKVVMDTTMKIRDTEKTVKISSNDPDHPSITVSIIAFIDPHKGLTSSDSAKIFKGKCATCHVMQGKGLMSDDLFFADCVMCHQFRPKPGHVVGGPLAPRNYDDPAVADFVKRATSFGTSHAMPGFLDKVGGPLSEAQIDSIVEFLKKYSRENR